MPAENKRKGWSIEFRSLTFMDKTVVQIYKDEEIRGSFTIDKTEEAEDEEFWKKLFSYASASKGGSD